MVWTNGAATVRGTDGVTRRQASTASRRAFGAVTVCGCGGRYPRPLCGRIVLTEQHNAHKTSLRTVRYRWHPF